MWDLTKKLADIGGVSIKLKLGKDDSTSPTADGESTTKKTSEITVEKRENDEPSDEKKRDLDSIRQVIKLNEKESSEEKKQEPVIEVEKREKIDAKPNTPPPVKEEGKKPEESATRQIKSPLVKKGPVDDKDDLEQRRNMLQTIKDFDFQIKKNQEDVGKLVEKVDILTKDLDDLVSLYEIVSEQMNPFVGLSKVTKKRIDALENFTQKFEVVENRIGDIESVIEKNLGRLPIREKPRVPPAVQQQQEEDNKDTKKNTEEVTPIVKESDKISAPISPPLGIPVDSTNTPLMITTLPSTSVQDTVGLQDQKNISYHVTTNHQENTFSDTELDIILEQSLRSLVAEQRIDNLINEFLLSLK